MCYTIVLNKDWNSSLALGIDRDSNTFGSIMLHVFHSSFQQEESTTRNLILSRVS
jgi:hypothetical protein